MDAIGSGRRGAWQRQGENGLRAAQFLGEVMKGRAVEEEFWIEGGDRIRARLACSWASDRLARGGAAARPSSRGQGLSA